jgi:hypothetical protein
MLFPCDATTGTVFFMMYFLLKNEYAYYKTPEDILFGMLFRVSAINSL